MYIDLNKAKKEFKKYVENYDYKNERISLKIKHTLKVMRVSKKVAKSLNLDKEDIELAELIGLLHDIGRFEQVKQYDTFVDSKSVNHGELGAKILFEEGLIRNFIQDDKYDKIIKLAILNHNRNAIEKNLKQRELLHCKIIRDADKIDIFRVLKKNSILATYGCENMEDQEISEEIIKEFFEDRHIDYSQRKTNADLFVCHMAYIFDLNFDYSLKTVKSKKYIDRLVNRINFQNPKTVEQIQKMIKEVNEYIEKKTNEIKNIAVS